MSGGSPFHRIGLPQLRKPGGKAHFALGRRRSPGQMNRTEARYEAEIIKPAFAAGSVVWWAFEAIKFKLADNTFFTPDFTVLPEDGWIELVDVKGAKILIEDDAKAKIKIAAALFPMRFSLAWPNSKRAGDWHREMI